MVSKRQKTSRVGLSTQDNVGLISGASTLVEERSWRDELGGTRVLVCGGVIV